MNPGAPTSASTIFGEALERPASERAAFLDRVCADRPELREELELLLEAHSRAGGFLDGDDGPAEPERIGPYLLTRRIGEGGFGVVYEAQQEGPIRRRVAVKIIKLGMDTRRVIARFEHERQALALMDHPCIARVFDAGATEQGRPYFVMELIEGVPITRYCDEQRLTIRQRLELLVPVCEAVQHAHQKGIIHRDIKPSNVLVSLKDGKAVPKIIDFGIAKAVGTQVDGEPSVSLTQHRELLGTPEYMSPEQAGFGGGPADIDTRSDVYSLGVLLYELLIGVAPHDERSLRSAAFAEMQRIIREEEPAKPSTRLSTLETLPNVAANRTIEPRRLGAVICGDLDWIVMKCLEKDRSRRYETASGLAADIGRHLAGEPVVAAPPTRRYRLAKFVRRHRGLVAAVTVVSVVLLGGIAGTSAGFVSSSRRAQSESRAKADAIAAAEFLSKMLGPIDMNEAGVGLSRDLRERFQGALTRRGLGPEQQAARAQTFGSDLGEVNATDAATALIDRTILQPAVTALDKEFKERPSVDGVVRQTLADVYQRLGLYDKAFPLQETALATNRRVRGDDDRNTLYSIDQMAGLLVSMGRAAEAEPYYRDALYRRRRTLGEGHADTLVSISNMGFVMEELGRPDDAQRYDQEAYDRRRSSLGEDDPATLMSLSNLAHVLQTKGEYPKAETLFRQVLDGRRRVLGEDNPDTVTAISNLGCVLIYSGKERDAVPYLREALEKRRRIFGEDHRETLNSMNNLASVLQDVGQLDEAEALFRSALDGCRRTLGPMHPDTLGSITNLAGFLQVKCDWEQVEALYTEALDKYRVVLGPDHPLTLVAINNMGWILQTRGKLHDAEKYYREALDLSKRILGPDSPDTARQLENLGNLLRMQGKLDNAEAYLREAEQKYRATLGTPSRETLVCLHCMGQLRMAQGRHEDAEKYFREAVDAGRASLGEEQQDTLHWTSSLGEVMTARGNPEGARELLVPALQRSRHLLGDAHQLSLSISFNLAGALISMQQFADAESLLVQTAALIDTRQPPLAAAKQKCARAMVKLYEARDKSEPGKGYADKAAEWRSRLEAAGASAPAK